MTDLNGAALANRLMAHAAGGTPNLRPLPSALRTTKLEFVERRTAFMPVERTPEVAFLPIQAPPVNRAPSARNPDESPQLYPSVWDRTFVDEDGTTKIIRMSRFGPFGADANDPCRPFSLAVPFGMAICPTLAGYAAARCGPW